MRNTTRLCCASSGRDPEGPRAGSATPAMMGRTRRRGTQGGFGLIEMMVAIVMALFVLAGLVSVFINMKVSYQAQDSLNQAQENERIALGMLRTFIQQGGFATVWNATSGYVDPSGLFAVDTTNGFGAAGQWITGVTNTGASDTISVRYFGTAASGNANCAGQTNSSATDVLWTNVFAVDAQGELTCTVVSGTKTWGPYPLVGNVNSMKVLYGVDTSAGSSGGPVAYLSASAINALNSAAGNTAGVNYWNYVYTVRITLTFNQTFSSGAGSGAAGATAPPVDETIFLMARSA